MDINSIMVLLILAVFPFLIYKKVQWDKREKEKNERSRDAMNKRIMTSKGFNAIQSVNGVGGQYAGVDKAGEILVKTTVFGEPTRVSRSEFLEAELEVNDSGLSKVKRGRQITGALAGGVLAGGVGAVIGAMGATSVSVRSVSSIKINILTSKGQGETYTIPLYRGRGLPADSPVVREALNKARTALLMFNKAVNAQETSHVDTASTGTSISDEIEKLSNLRDSGVISYDEFIRLKRKIIEK